MAIGSGAATVVRVGTSALEGGLAVFGVTTAEEVAGIAAVIRTQEMSQKAALDKLLKTKIDLKDKNDGKKVLKVSDAVKIIEDYFNTAQLLGDTLIGIAKTFGSAAFGPGQPSAIGKVIGKKLAEKIRAKALSQRSRRVYGTKTGQFRL